MLKQFSPQTQTFSFKKI